MKRNEKRKEGTKKVNTYSPVIQLNKNTFYTNSNV